MWQIYKKLAKRQRYDANFFKLVVETFSFVFKTCKILQKKEVEDADGPCGVDIAEFEVVRRDVRAARFQEKGAMKRRR